MNIDQHPTVQRIAARMTPENAGQAPRRLDAAWLRETCRAAGADDVGFVEIDRPALAGGEREEIRRYAPHTKALIGYVCRVNREPIRNTARSVANLEFHHVGDHVNDVGRRIVAALETEGVRAINPSMGFPMEMSRFPGRLWVVSHKLVAQEAGLGVMGIHRNVIHPTFGNFILLGTIVMDAEVSEYGKPLDYNPCLECKLCVAACPVGAISADGHFNFNSCYTHNYREFMGGFNDWVEEVVDSKGRNEYRRRVEERETVSWWQSLTFGANYKAAYCMAVCPAGEEVLPPFLHNRQQFTNDVLRPLQQVEESVYVIRASDAEAHVRRRFPHKTIKHVRNTLRPRSLDQFVNGLSWTFQRHQSTGLDATYHFTFTGREHRKLTVVVRDGELTVAEGHVGRSSIRVTADTATWLGFLARERNLVWALLRGHIRIHGNLRLLVRFGRCFPS